MRVEQLMDALRRLNPHMQVGIQTHGDVRQVKFVEKVNDDLAVIDIRFSGSVDLDPEE